MLRKFILPIAAAAALAGCATDYRYRAGNGDYYYGSPRVEYRHLGPGGFYGSYGYGSYGLGYGYGGYGYGPTYFYDAFGRLVYGYPSAYGYGSGWYRPRVIRHGGHPHGGRGDRGGHDGRGHGDADGDGDRDRRHDRRPPWRNLDGLQPRVDAGDGDIGMEPRLRRQRSAPDPEAFRQPRPSPGPAPVTRDTGGSRSMPVTGPGGRGGSRLRTDPAGAIDE